MATVTIKQVMAWDERYRDKLLKHLAGAHAAVLYGQSFEIWNIDEAGALTVRPIPAEEIYLCPSPSSPSSS